MFLKNCLFKLKIITSSTKFRTLSSIKRETLNDLDKGITVVSLDSPKTRNALSKQLVQSLSEVFEELVTDTTTRVVILRSLVPRIFCAGADLKERITMTESEIRLFLIKLNDLMFKIENCPYPVISALDGAALGGGLEIALATDIRIASEMAKIGLVETKHAIIPGAGGTQRLSRLIGSSLAKELIFTARIIDGKTAKDYGIVNHVTNSDKSDSAYQKSLEIAREILPNGPLATKVAKLAINKGKEVDIYQGCTIEGLCYSQIIPTTDRLEGLKAFTEKRKPKYKGE